ncbi:effector-associated domain EAD1-containing protein [Vibrio splendidus]
MKIEQAIYGEVRSGHALKLASTRNTLIESLASRLDLPDTAPSGVNWSPYITGFPYDDKYVLARTFSDPYSTRSGMVISHALILPLEGIMKIANLKLLFTHLINSPEIPTSLTTLEIPISTESPVNDIDLTSTAEALIRRDVGPAVKIGIFGFEELIVDLWFNLWPEFREKFAFRLSFGPKDIVETPQPTIVCTPSTLETRWAGGNIIRLSSSRDVSTAAAIISGSSDASPILKFANELGVRLDKLTDLPLLARAYELNSVSTPTFENTVTTIRLIDKLSPIPTLGVGGKEKLISTLCSQMSEAGICGILQLRNLNIIGFDETNCIWDELENWVAANTFKETDDLSFMTAVDDSFSLSTAIEDWRKAMLGGIKRASLSESQHFSAAFWRWAHIKPKTLASLFEYLPSGSGLSRRLCNAGPLNISASAGDVIMTIALSKKWLRLHGVAAGGCLEPSDAAYRQISIDTDPTHIDGVKAALRRATEYEIVDLAIETGENRIICLAAEKVAHLPSLLKPVNFNAVSAQRLWAQALSINGDSWQGPENPQNSMFIILKGLLAGRETSSELLHMLSVTPIADLFDYGDCSEVWLRLIEPARSHFLKTTASSWLERSILGNITEPDSELEAAINLDHNLDTALQALVLTDMIRTMRLIEVLPSYKEPRFLMLMEHWLKGRHTKGFSEAEFLGKVISQRNWQQAVNILLSAVKAGQSEVKPALRNCLHMVGYLDQWICGLSAITSDEKWLILEELASELYPGGPDHNEFWDRAGGRNSQLRYTGTGQARWHDAISHVRKGKGPTLAQLLGEMARDYPANSQIKNLSNYAESMLFS